MQFFLRKQVNNVVRLICVLAIISPLVGTAQNCTGVNLQNNLSAGCGTLQNQTNINKGDYQLLPVANTAEYQFTTNGSNGNTAITGRQSSGVGTSAFTQDANNISTDDEDISWTSTFSGNLAVIVTESLCGWNANSAVLDYRQVQNFNNTTSTARLCNGDARTLTTSGNGTGGAWSLVSGPGTLLGNIYTANGGTGSVTVRYTLGACSEASSFSVVDPAVPAITNITHNLCFGDNAGAITVTATGGAAPYTYVWSNGTTSIGVSAFTNSITGLSGGTYTVTVTETCGSALTASATVNEPSVPLSGSITNSTNILCNGGLGGTATASAAGGSLPYNYIWSTGSSLASITGLAAGIYTVTISDANGCGPITDNVTITEPAVLSISISKSDESCASASDGSITAVVSGGTVPFTYLWSNGESTALLNNLSSGNYSLTLTDANGCIENASANITVVDNVFPTFSSCPSNSSVNNDAGLCSAIVFYSPPTAIDNCAGVVVTQTAGLGSGSAFPLGLTVNTFLATDASGNTATCSFNVMVSDTTTPSITCTANINTANDVGLCGAVVTYATPIGSATCSPVTITQTDNSGLTSGDLFPLGTTTIQYTAADTSGNSTSCSFTITVQDNENPVFSCLSDINAGNDAGLCGAIINYTAPTATDNCNIASITQTDATGLTNGDTFPIGTTTLEYTAIDVNGNQSICSFNVIVTDTSSPQITCSANITQINDLGLCGAIVTFASPTTSDNCAVDTMFQTGGLVSGSFFTIGATTNSFEVIDIHGNSSTCSFIITVTHDSINITSVVPDRALCSISNTFLTASVSGEAPYNFQWFKDGALIAGATDSILDLNNATPFDAGDYQVLVYNSCSFDTSAPINVTIWALPPANAGVDQTTCSGGSIILQASGGTTYEWSNGSVGQALVVAPNQTTDYMVTVTDIRGCQAEDTVTVFINQPPNIVILGDTLVCNGSGITLEATGATDYSWSTGAVTAAINISPTINTTYIVYATDSNGCNNSASTYIEVAPLPQVSIIDTNLIAPICIQIKLVPLAATPAGGVFTGDGVYWFNNQYYFYPDSAGLWIHDILYTYTSPVGCSNSDVKTVTVIDCPDGEPWPVGIEEEHGLRNITVYPNPFETDLMVKFESDKNQRVTLRLIDITGRQLYAQDEMITAGDNSLSVPNVDEIAAGMYYLVINQNGKSAKTFKIIKSK